MRAASNHLRSGVLLVAALLAGPAAAQPAPSGEAPCVPACRSGYVCLEARCVSRCNPPCGAAESCTDGGECRATTTPTAAPVAPVTPLSPAPLNPSGLGSCYSNEQCIPPSVCVQAYCRVSQQAVRDVRSSGMRHLVAGAVVLVLGVGMLVTSVALLIIADSIKTPGADLAYWSTGWSLLGTGAATTALIGPVTMGVGGARLRRAARLSHVVLGPWLPPAGGGLAFRAAF